MSIRREDLTPEWVNERFKRIKEGGQFEPLTDEEREDSLRNTLADVPPGEDVWLFGYGSLMWNPTVIYEQQRAGRIYGYHRRYCFWIKAGRGSPEMPGLMLGLDRGGCCQGQAFRIKAHHAREELELVWRREMISGVYVPRWVRLHSPEGDIRAVTFVVDRGHKQYIEELPPKKAALHLAKAEGFLGSSRIYLENTIQHLHGLGYSDSYLNRLHRLVRSHD
jgi:cation transport protein ChaC